MNASARHDRIFYLVMVLLMTFHLLTYVHSQGAGDVWFSLNGTTYQNNSCVALEDIGEGDDALQCVTNQTACCKQASKRNWFFPNGTRVPSKEKQWDFYRSRGQMVVRLNRRQGGEDGTYRCEIPDSMNVTQNIYIGVYSAGRSDVWFSLNGTTYQNKSCVAMEDIDGGNSSTLCCVTNQTACCRPPYTGEKWPGKRNCFFPNGTCVADGDTVSGHLEQVQESHLNIQVRVPLFHDNFCGKILYRLNLVFMYRVYRVLCWGSRHWNCSQGLREKGSCKVGLAWSSCMQEETESMCSAQDKCLEMVTPRYSSRPQGSKPVVMR